MNHYRLRSAYLADGWAENAVVSVSSDGFITRINRDPSPGEFAAALVEEVAGIVVPGMANAHSHAFQRAMAGNTEYRLSSRDSFWTWRRSMYALANRIEPGDLQILAAQLFVEMLKAGYTSVAEFHYLHRQRSGEAYAAANELWHAIGNAAEVAGIGLTFLPTLYQTANFGGQALRADQRRFETSTGDFLKVVEDRLRGERRNRSATRRTGIAFHSLRAVPIASLRQVTDALRDIDAEAPIHIHVAEQSLEVKDCKAATGLRPIELLLDTRLLTDRWCLVHATHATAEELKGIAAAGSSVCVSVSTEANLGDGLFDTARFLGCGGRLCIGSDSQSTVNPAEELRWLEYQQRLKKRRRGVLATFAEPHVGTRLWRDAAQHGAHAIGQPAGALRVGLRADWLVLDPEHPSMAGAVAGTALDHLLFAGGEGAIRDVMVAGRQVIKGRRHAADDELRPRFAELMARLSLTGERTRESG